MVAGAIAMPAMTSIVPARTVSRRWNTEVDCLKQIANFDFLSRFGSSDGSDTMASPCT